MNKEEFEKKVSKCLGKCDLFPVSKNKRNSKQGRLYKDEAEYQKSFDDIIVFSKMFKPKQKKDINAIIFHDDNEDGIISAFVFYQFLKGKDIVFVPAKPYSGEGYNKRVPFDKLEGKNAVVLDIAFSRDTLAKIKEKCASLIIIDDHERNSNNNSLSGLDAFVGVNHATCAYAYKFLNPSKKVPHFIQYTDNSDKRLFLNYLPYDNLFKTFYNFRIYHSPYFGKKDNVAAFEKMEELLTDDNREFKLLAGYFYDQVSNNIKDQVARNARPAKFQNHNVVVLNYNDPVLYKMVARQMLSNAEKQGQHPDFAVLWGYEYTSQAYKVFLSEKHTSGRPRFNLPKLARELGKKGGSGKAGQGKDFIGNFYWKKNIWDLFG